MQIPARAPCRRAAPQRGGPSNSKRNDPGRADAGLPDAAARCEGQRRDVSGGFHQKSLPARHRPWRGRFSIPTTFERVWRNVRPADAGRSSGNAVPAQRRSVTRRERSREGQHDQQHEPRSAESQHRRPALSKRRSTGGQRRFERKPTGICRIAGSSRGEARQHFCRWRCRRQH